MDQTGSPTDYDPMDTTKGNRFSPYGPNDHGALGWISASMALTYSFIVLIIRCYIKIRVFGPDDWTLLLGTMVGLGQYITIYAALNQGLGKPPEVLNHQSLSDSGKTIFTSQILLIIALCLSKSSTTLLIRRLFTRELKNDRTLCDILLGIMVLWGICSSMALGINCAPEAWFLSPGRAKCPSLATRWKFVVAFDLLTELLIFLIPCVLLYQLNMKTGPKIRVIAAFAFRVLGTILSLLYLLSLLNYLDKSPSPREVMPVIVWQQIVIGYFLIAATIPNLKSFVETFYTGMGHDMGYGSHTYSKGHSYPLSDLSKTSNRSKRSREAGLVLRPELLKNEARISRGDPTESRGRDTRSVAESESSQDMIIRRDVRWEVSHGPYERSWMSSKSSPERHP